MLRPRSQSKGAGTMKEGEEATAEESDSDEVGQRLPPGLTAPPHLSFSVAQVVSFSSWHFRIRLTNYEVGCGVSKLNVTCQLCHLRE